MGFLFGLAFGLLVALLAFGAPFLRSSGPRRPYALRMDDTPRHDLSIVVAAHFGHRMVGLLNHARLGENDGLWLPKTNAVHTQAMHFPIDVLFLDAAGRILIVHSNVEPGRRLKGPWGCRHTLELRADAAARLGLVAGKKLELLEKPV